MKPSKEKNRENCRKILDKLKVSYESLNNDTHWKMGTVNFFPTTLKWFDEYTQERGEGINELLKHISTPEITEPSVIDKKQLSVDDLYQVAKKVRPQTVINICEVIHRKIYS